MDSYQITFQTWNKIASLYQDKFMDFDLYNDTYDTFCELVQKPEARVFEIGCGPGNIIRYLLSKRPDLQIEAIDVAPNMIELARKNNPSATFKVMDCREIDKLTENYDAIICGFCMPYLSREDCAKLIKDCAGLLSSGGILYFSTIEGNYSQSGYEVGSSGDKAYVNYHEEANLLQGLKENSFELVNLVRKQFQKPDGTPSTHLIFISRKV